MQHDFDNDIAVVGLACRVPGAPDVETLWGNLLDGVDAITREYDPFTSEVIRAGGAVDGLEMFDASFFRMSAREASLLDPQHRMFLECAWAALEQAGAGRRKADAKVGVFGGTGISTYLLNNLWPTFGGADRPLVDSAEDMQLLLATDKDFLVGRTAYLLDLTGPVATVQAACASGLFAVHLAVQALLAGECDLALAGASNATVPQLGLPGREDGTYISRDGVTRTFDRRASGSVFGSGGGVVALKVLGDALRDGDLVRAVVKGSAVNNDGSAKSGFTAPSSRAQREVIEQALATAGAQPCDIGLVEAHGTATPIGDPIEVAALREVLDGAAPESVLLSGIKPNIGHLGWAAGIIGLCKAVLCVEHGKVPPQLHCDAPNPELGLDGSPLRVVTEPTTWNADRSKLAGVSAFGIGGFNAHVLLHAAPDVVVPTAPGGRQVVVAVSAASPVGLVTAVERWADAVEAADEGGRQLADLAHTALHRRSALPVRHASVGSDAATLSRSLRRGARRVTPGAAGRVIGLFTGYTPTLARVAADLVDEPVFRKVLECSRPAVVQCAGTAPLELLVEGASDASAGLVERHIAQYVLQCGLWELWRSWGVDIDVVCGHSLGESAAAYAAGVVDLASGVALVGRRASLLLELPADTGMAALDCDPRWAQHLCEVVGCGEVEIAAYNGPENTVITGRNDAVALVCEAVRSSGGRGIYLDVPIAGHSQFVEPLLPQLAKAFADVTLARPERTFVSGTTGGLVDDELMSTAYWCDQMRRPVRFADVVKAAREAGVSSAVEIGAAPVLTALLDRLDEPFPGPVTGALRPGEPAWARLLDGVAQLWSAGVDLRWPVQASDGGRAAPAPTAGFDRHRHWIDPPPATTPQPSPAELAVAPIWVDDPVDAPAPAPLPGRHHLLIAGQGELAAALLAGLVEDDALCTVVVPPGDTRTWPDAFEVWPVAEATELCARLTDPVLPLSTVVLTNGLDLPPPLTVSWDEVEHAVFGVVELLREIDEADPPVPVLLVTRGAQPAGGVAPSATMAAAWAILRSAVIEDPSRKWACLDLDPDATPQADVVAVQNALARPEDAESVARGDRRLVHRLTRLSASIAPADPALLDPREIHLVTGGWGTLGLVAAGDLIDRGARRVLLAGRHEPSDVARATIERLAERAEVLTRRVDVADPEQVDALVADVVAHGDSFGGVVHTAGVIDDHTLATMPEEAVRNVFAGKVRGAWNLHSALDGISLGYFTVYSSVAGILGNAGQANYAAANAMLDALVQARVAEGRPGLALAWGAWTDAGLLASRPELVAALHERGLAPLPTGTAVAAIRALTTTASGVIALTRHDWRTWCAPLPPARQAFYTDLLGDPRPHLVEAPPAVAPPPEHAAVDLAALAPDAQWSAAAAVVGEALADVVGAEVATPIGEASLTDLGLDSFSAIGLRSRIRDRLGVTLSMTVLLAGSTTAAVVDAVVAAANGEAPTPVRASLASSHGTAP